MVRSFVQLSPRTGGTFKNRQVQHDLNEALERFSDISTFVDEKCIIALRGMTYYPPQLQFVADRQVNSRPSTSDNDVNAIECGYATRKLYA